MIGIHGVFFPHPIDVKRLHDMLLKDLRKYLFNHQAFSRGLLAKISLKKFERDRVFREYDGNVGSLDGNVLNLKKLLIEGEAKDLGALILGLCMKDSTSFPSKLLGLLRLHVSGKREQAHSIYRSSRF